MSERGCVSACGHGRGFYFFHHHARVPFPPSKGPAGWALCAHGAHERARARHTRAAMVERARRELVSRAELDERRRTLLQHVGALQQRCILSARKDLGPGGWQETARGGCIAIDPATGQYHREPFDARAVFAINAAYHQMQMHSVVHEPEYVFSAELFDKRATRPTDEALYDRPPHRLRMDKLLARAVPLFDGSERAKHTLARPDAHACAVRLIEEIKRLAESKDWSPSMAAPFPNGGYTWGVAIRMNPDWLPRDPRAAALPKAPTTGAAFKHRMAVDPGRDAAYNGTGIFDEPKTARHGPPGEAEAAAGARAQASFEEAQQRFAVVLTMLSAREKRDYQRCLDACIARARRSHMLHRMCVHLRRLYYAELEARKPLGSPLVKFLGSSQDFLDVLLPRIDPVAGLRLMETCKAMLVTGKENNRGCVFELVRYPAAAATAAETTDVRVFPAHHPPNSKYDKPQLNAGKYIRLLPRVCFRFMTNWTQNTWGPDPDDPETDPAKKRRVVVATEEKHELKDHVFDQAPKDCDLDRTMIGVDLVLDDEARTLVRPVDDTPTVEIGSGSGQRGREWVARRLPKMRIAVNVKSSARRPMAAYRLRVTLSSSKLTDNRTHPIKNLVCYTDAFYVIGRAYKDVGKASKVAANRAKDERSRAHTAEYRRGMSKAEAEAAWPDNVWAE